MRLEFLRPVVFPPWDWRREVRPPRSCRRRPRTMKPGTAPLLVRSPLHDALFAVSTKAVAATTGTVSGVWGEHKALLLSTAATLALLAPVLLRLPRKAGITAAVLVVALLQMAFDMPPDQVLLEASVVLCLTGIRPDFFRSEAEDIPFNKVAYGLRIRAWRVGTFTIIVLVLGRRGFF